MKEFYRIKSILLLAIIFLSASTAFILIGCYTYEPKMCTITYVATEGGRIEGNLTQEVIYGEDGETVTAVPDEGYRFVRWDGGLSLEPSINELNVRCDKTIKAVFERIVLKVEISGVNGGFYIDGENCGASRRFWLNYGETFDKSIVAKPFPFNNPPIYTFIEWSDGLKTPERNDSIIVTEDINLTAYFGLILSYSVDGNKGGTIQGKTTQILEDGRTGEVTKSESVVAIPDDGYVFAGWSDLSTNPKRLDRNVEWSKEYIAYFEPVKKTFKYDYNGGTPMPTASVTLTRENVGSVEFPVPERQGYTFCGWYTDTDYTVKVANDRGKYMLGYYGLTLESETLYARWRDVNDDKLYYPILFVNTDEVKVTLYSSKISQDIDVHYKMTGLERKTYMLMAELLCDLLNEWLEGKVIFEPDVYFTTEIIDYVDAFEWGIESSGQRSYGLEGKRIKEIADMRDNYRNVMMITGMNDYDYYLHSGAGESCSKYGKQFVESIWDSYMINNIPLQTVYEELTSNNESKIYERLGVLMHEFIHTIETKYSYYEIYEFHKWIGKALNDQSQEMEVYRQYLLGIAEADGEIIGIPQSYWVEGGYYEF